MEPSGDIKINSQSFVVENAGKLREHYRIGKILGSGAFGEVRICVHKDSNTQRAVKVLRKAAMDEEEQKMLFNEINILRNLDHPNIVKMYEFFQDEKRFYLITELCKGGELFDEIISRGHFNEKDTAILMNQLLSCINYVHLNNIVHRDLKPENILLEASKDFDQIKVIDFGTSLVYDKTKPLKEKLGTPYYIAPEVLNKKYDEKCDIWSIGVILYIILSGTPPFNGNSDAEIMKKVKAGKFTFDIPEFKNVSEKAKDLISKLLIYDPAQRISAQEALKHPFITDLSDAKLDSNLAQGALANLKTFRADQKLKQATFAYIASQLLSKSEKENLSKVFKALDANGDGKLSKDEILNGYDKYFGKVMSVDDVDNLFKSVDIDDSGFIDYSEFVIATMNEKQLLTNDKLAAAFKMFDKDGSGMISGDEIKVVLKQGSGQLSEEALDLIVKQVDDNGDGEISFEEFCTMMKSLAI